MGVDEGLKTLRVMKKVNNIRDGFLSMRRKLPTVSCGAQPWAMRKGERYKLDIKDDMNLRSDRLKNEKVSRIFDVGKK